MDAQAYLMRHGWDGPGNPLNPNRRPGPHGGLGLTRPILVARKQNKDGVGRKTTKDPTNQWWLRGFEEALRGVGEDGTANDSGIGEQGSSLIRNGSELYKFFVRGEGLKGTIEENAKRMKGENEKGSSKEKKSKSKRKRDDDDEEAESKEARALRKEEKRKKRKMKEEAESAPNQDTASSAEMKEERRDRKKREKKEKKDRKEKKASSDDNTDDQKKSFRDERKKDKKRKKEITAAEQDYPTPLSTEESSLSGSADDEKGSSKLKKDKKGSKKSKEKKEKKRSKTDTSDEIKKEKSKKRKREEKSSSN